MRVCPVFLLAWVWPAGFLAGAEGSGPDFNRVIRPILSDRCYLCHGPDAAKREADLRLDDRDAAIQAGVLVPGKPEESPMYRRMLSDDPDEVMPPPGSHLTLTGEEKEAVRSWIERGAAHDRHWSFKPVPENVEVPRVEDKGWARSELDRFVFRSLADAGKSPAPEAEPELWLRRVSFSLTGLAPSEEELDAFLNERNGGREAEEDAAERVVDRLLGGVAHAEHMASLWMDAARYADTFGYQNDLDMHMWPWRDWVIRAFHENMPYDRFLTWQIAGDLLPDATTESRLATGFNRLHRQTNEGGSVDEEFRVEQVSDRVHTVGTAFLGLTLECARCHDHKYDPVSMRDYYSLTAFFDQIDEAGLYSHFTRATPAPALLLYAPGEESAHREALERVREAEEKLASHWRESEAEFGRWREENGDVEVPVAVLAEDFEEAALQGENKAVEGRQGRGVMFSGDDAFRFGEDAGAFRRMNPFSLAVWVKPGGEAKPRQILAHRSRAWSDAGGRGYELLLDHGRPDAALVHFWPGNAIRVRGKEPLQAGEWSHLAMVYDGSSRASGLKLYVNGKRLEGDEVEIVRDSLTRDVDYRAAWGDETGGIALTLGERFRDTGFAGGVMDEFKLYDRELSPLEVALAAGRELPGSEENWKEHFFLRVDEESARIRGELLEWRKREDEVIGRVREVMTMKDLPGIRATHLLERGVYDAKGEIVEAGVPDAVMPFPEGVPGNRLGLAHWMTDPEQPLTARVAVNGWWALLFGRGLVSTNEDFGLQGSLPSHPELLDWMARRLMDGGWDVRALLKEIALSSTFRMSSVPVSAEDWKDDPDNELLARGPRRRLGAEMIRDQALQLSGLLVEKTGGPSVKPYQVPGLYEEAGAAGSYRQDEGEGLYRRSLYTYWKRTMPAPMMMAFDTTTREVCTVKREVTMTPMQALVTMNDPQFLEAARVWAERLHGEIPGDAAERIRKAFRRASARFPTERESAALLRLYSEQREIFLTEPEAARSWLEAGDFRKPGLEGTAKAELAATAVVLNAILNLDASMTLR